MSRRFRTPAALILILASAGTLAGCGVKGPLEPPPKAAASSAASATPAAAAAPAEASGETSWSINQANMVADTGTAAPPLSASAATPTASTPAASTAAGSGSQRLKSTHAGGSSAAPTGLDQIPRPNTPFILDGLL